MPGRAGHRRRPRLLIGGVARDAAAASRAPHPFSISAPLAAARDHHVLPLRHEHVHGLGMGHRVGGPVPVPARVAEHLAVDGRGAGRRRVAGDPGGQAPRRLLPLAVRVHGALRARQPVSWRRRAGVHRRGAGAGDRRRDLPLAVGPPRRAVREGERVQRVLRGPAPRAARRVRERVGDLVRRRQGQERDQHDVPLQRVVPDGAAAAALHQHLLRRRAGRPLGRRRERVRRNNLLVHRQPLHDHHRRGRHRDVPEPGRPARDGLGAAGVRRVDPSRLVLAPQRDGQAAAPAPRDLLQLRGPQLRAPPQRAAQRHGPRRRRRRGAPPRVPRRAGRRLRHGPRRRGQRQGQQRARARVRGPQRARRPRRHVLGTHGRRRPPERVLDRAAPVLAGAGVQCREDPGARRARAARGAAPGVRGRRARSQRHHGRAQAAAPAGPARRRTDGEGLGRGGAEGTAPAVGGGTPPRPLRRGGHGVNVILIGVTLVSRRRCPTKDAQAPRRDCCDARRATPPSNEKRHS